MKCDDCKHNHSCGWQVNHDENLPFQPPYIPYGMSREQFEYEVYLAQQSLEEYEAEWEGWLTYCPDYEKEEEE